MPASEIKWCIMLRSAYSPPSCPHQALAKRFARLDYRPADAVLVVVDRLKKQALFIPTTKYMAAPDVASLFVQHVVMIHGLPETLVSDCDPVFTSHFWTRLLELCGIRANRSSAFQPQTDGQTERLNSMLKQYLRMYCDY